MAQIILDSANNLIQGDFDTATLSLRTRMQTSTTNATTGVYVVPNGSATSASVQVSNAADPTNASKVVVATNASTDTQIVSGANGSGSYLPLSFYTNNDIRFQMGNAGELNVRTAPGTVSSGTSGQFLTSGGPGAGVSWTTAGGGALRTQLFTAPGTWTNPGSVTQVKVTVVGGAGGGGCGPGSNSGSTGGTGGLAIASFTIPTSPVSVTVGSAGSGGVGGNVAGNSGSTSSFGPYLSATGGSGGPTSPGTAGSGTGSISAPIIPGALKQLNMIGLTSLDFLTGTNTNPSAAGSSAVTYSYTSPVISGGGGAGSSGVVGPGGGGVSGVVVVEFVG
jgi:hypothetical protein